MAGNIGDLLVRIKGDAKSYKDAVKTSEVLSKQLAKQVETSGKKIEEVTNSWIGNQVRHATEVGKTYTALSKNLDIIQNKIGKETKATRGMAFETVIANKKIRDLGNSLKYSSNQLWIITTGLQQFGRSMSMAFTAPIVGAAAVSLKTFVDLEKGTIAIQRAAEITSKEANKITDSFVKISQEVPITVEELQKAGYAAAQAGITGEKAITNFAETVVKLSKVGGDAFKDLPIEELSNDLAKLSIAFKVSSENMEEVNNTASMLLAVSKAIPGGLGEVVESLRRAAGAATTYGISLETTTALVGTLVASAVPAARAGTELSAVFHSMVGKVNLVGEVLGYLGEDLTKLKERMQEDMGEVLIELLGRLGATEDMFVKNEIATEIFGETGKKALLPLINNFDLLIDLQARANQELESGILLEAEFDIQAQSLSGTIKTFTNNIQALGYVVGKDLAPYVNFFLKNFTLGLRNLVEGWKNLSPSIKFAIFLMGSLLAVVGPLALVLNTMFLSPIAGLVTFITHTVRLTAELAIQTAIASSAGMSMNAYAFSLKNAAANSLLLGKGLLILVGKFAGILIIVGAVTVALYVLAKALGKIFGIGFKLPSMPEMKLPEYGKIDAPEFEAGEGADVASKEEKDAAKKKEKALTKEIRDKKRARDKELKALEQGINDYEKVRKAEIKERQKLVDEQREALDIRREQWEDEKRIEDEKIRAQEETLKAAKKTLKLSKQSLKELEATMDDEVDTAENRVEYAEMNLEAAQDALKREKILGRDEYYESFRLAEARVEAWEDAVQLARENVLKVKKEYQKQIDVQEDLVDANQEQVDVQTDALDKLKVALDERRAIVDKEIDLLDDELKIRQAALDKIRDSTQEKLDILREEKDIRGDAWDEEIDILQERLDAARDYAQALQDAGLSELPEATKNAVDEYNKFAEEFKEQADSLQKEIGESLSFGIKVEEGSLMAKIIEDVKGGIEDIKKSFSEAGKSLGKIFSEENFNTLKENLEIGWKGIKTTWDGLWQGLKENKTIKSIETELSQWGERIKISLGIIWDGIKSDWEALWTALEPWIEGFKKTFEIFWEDLKRGWETFKTEFGSAWDEFWENKKRKWEKIWIRIKTYIEGIWNIIKGVIQIAWGIISGTIEVGLAILARNWSGVWEGIKNSFRNIWEGIKSIIRGAWKVISSIFDFSGLKSRFYKFRNEATAIFWQLVDWVTNAAWKLYEWIKTPFEWIGDLIKRALDIKWKHSPSIVDNVKSGVKEIKNAYRGLGSFMDSEFGNKGLSTSISNSGLIGDSQRTIQGVANAQSVGGTPATQSVINRNFYIQPGQMIASRGEVRNFARMLKEYDEYEARR